MILINIGIDIGGTHIGMGLVDDEGKIKVEKYLYYESKAFRVESALRGINEFIREYEDSIESVGIGIPGIATNTYVHYTCNLSIQEIELRDYLQCDKPIFVSNDANCATIAEYQFVDRKMFLNYILITVGTGIGSGIILNGNLYTGSSGTAGEAGHMVIEKDGLDCGCGRKGCFEKYASITALLKMTGAENLKELFYLIERNNNIANIFEKYVEYLAEGLANVINLYDPEMLVIGGSLSEYEEKFLYILKSKLVSKIYNKYTYDFNIKTARLGNSAGIIGASILNQYLK